MAIQSIPKNKVYKIRDKGLFAMLHQGKKNKNFGLFEGIIFARMETRMGGSEL